MVGQFHIHLLLCICIMMPSTAAAIETFELRDGDRVVMLGNTLIEREQRYGYWEAELTRHYPTRNIIFRNLGWSGDTVFGEARARFGTAADGFRHLKEHVEALKPTVILIGYGTNESFEGQEGLPRFLEGLNGLLDTLAVTKARLVLLSPVRQENLGRPLPDPAVQNQHLQLYGDALRTVAQQRNYPFVDLFKLIPDGAVQDPRLPLTDNGLHYTAYGYWRSAGALREGLGIPATPWRLDLDVQRKEPIKADHVKIAELQSAPLRFTSTDRSLPFPPPTSPPRPILPNPERVLRISNLAPGKYELRIDGKPIIAAGAAEWAAGIGLERGPEFEQAELLRATIIEKNRQYFHRWRPQNETYLLGFRKHEQGQNAKEIVQFDPFIAQLETEIARLRVPVSHDYELREVK